MNTSGRDHAPHGGRGVAGAAYPCRSPREGPIRGSLTWQQVTARAHATPPATSAAEVTQ